jgi:toxin ParE1/3/4
VAKVTWTAQAREDLEANYLYIARDSLRYAKLTVDKIFAAIDNLEQFPMLGRVVPEIQVEDIRELIVGKFRIVYRVSEKEVEILMLHHSARPFTPPEST